MGRAERHDSQPRRYYRVEILPCDAAGNVAAGAPYLKADVYQRSYTFVADKAWTGNFVVRVTPYNTNDDPNQADNFNTSGVQTFMHALPTPEIEFRLVKRENGALTGISARRRMKNGENSSMRLSRC